MNKFFNFLLGNKLIDVRAKTFKEAEKQAKELLEEMKKFNEKNHPS